MIHDVDVVGAKEGPVVGGPVGEQLLLVAVERKDLEAVAERPPVKGRRRRRRIGGGDGGVVRGDVCAFTAAGGGGRLGGYGLGLGLG